MFVKGITYQNGKRNCLLFLESWHLRVPHLWPSRKTSVKDSWMLGYSERDHPGSLEGI